MQQYDGQGVKLITRVADSFYRHRLVFVITIAIVTGVAMIALRLRKPMYFASASTRVVSDQQVISSVLGEQADHYYGVSAAQSSANQFNDLMGDDRPDGFVDTALKNAQLYHPIDVNPRDGDPRFAMLRKRLVVAADSDSLFTISLTWDDINDCEKIVTAFQAQYIEEISSNRQATSIATTKFLDTEIADYQRRMRGAEQALINYKQYNVGQSSDAQAEEIQQLSSLKGQRDTLMISSQDSSLKKEALQERLALLPKLAVAEQDVADGPTLLAIRNLQSKRAGLIADGYLPTSDTVGNVDHMIELMQHEADEESKKNNLKGKVVLGTAMEDNPEYRAIDQQLTAAKIAEQTQISQLTLINQKIADYEALVAKIPEAQRELNDKTRDYTILKSEYEHLLEQREQADLKARLDKITAESTLIPVGTVYAVTTLAHSKVLMMAAGAAFVGVILGILVVIYSEWTDPTLRYGGDVERILDLPLLAETSDLPIGGSNGSVSRLAPGFQPRGLLKGKTE